MDIKAIKPISYGVLKHNSLIVDALTATQDSYTARVDACIAFLRLGFPDATAEEFEAFSPGIIIKGAEALYVATFARPEDDAPDQASH